MDKVVQDQGVAKMLAEMVALVDQVAAILQVGVLALVEAMAAAAVLLDTI